MAATGQYALVILSPVSDEAMHAIQAGTHKRRLLRLVQSLAPMGLAMCWFAPLRTRHSARPARRIGRNTSASFFCACHRRAQSRLRRFIRSFVTRASGRTICDQAPELLELFPDGIGGSLVRTRYVTGVDNDPFSTRPYTSETRLLRVSNGAVQYSNVVDYAERIGMTDNAGIAYTFGAAMNVLDWTPIFTTSFEPVIPLVNGNTAMHEVSTGLLHEVNAAGVSVASGAFGGRWGYQSAFGLWTSAESGQLTARLSLPLNEAGISFQFLGRMGTGQNAPPDKTFPDREIAGLKALDFIYDTSADANFEYGGLICHRNGRFEWSEIRTSRNQSMVVVPDTLCPPGALAARYHTHPGLGEPSPLRSRRLRSRHREPGYTELPKDPATWYPCSQMATVSNADAQLVEGRIARGRSERVRQTTSWVGALYRWCSDFCGCRLRASDSLRHIPWYSITVHGDFARRWQSSP
jgi:hypothetical protein